MGLIEKQKFVCIDCETTGLDIMQDKIIEAAAIIFDMRTTYGQFQTLVDPQCPISAESIAIHHITQDMVNGKPPIKDVLPELLTLIGNHIIVGHGVTFDIEMLAKSAEACGIKTTLKQNQVLDTLRMARLYGQSPTNSLEDLRKHFHIEPEIAHRAMSDVIVNIEVFRWLAKPYKKLETLQDILSRPILLKEMPLGKHKGRPFKEIPLEYLRWAVRKDFDQDLIYSLKEELKKRKRGNLFSQSTNPFMDL